MGFELTTLCSTCQFSTSYAKGTTRIKQIKLRNITDAKRQVESDAISMSMSGHLGSISIYDFNSKGANIILNLDIWRLFRSCPKPRNVTLSVKVSVTSHRVAAAKNWWLIAFHTALHPSHSSSIIVSILITSTQRSVAHGVPTHIFHSSSRCSANTTEWA